MLYVRFRNLFSLLLIPAALAWALTSAALLAGCGASPLPGEEQLPAAEDTPAPDEPASTDADPSMFRQDETLARENAFTEPLDDGNAPRPVGSLKIGDGKTTELVVYELMVAVMDQEQLEHILARWNAEVLDSTEPDEYDDPADPRDYLIRIDPSVVDITQLEAHMSVLEPHLAGPFVASSDAVLKTLAAAAEETVVHGTEVSLNWLTEGDAITDGTSMESPSLGQPNAFLWSFVRSLSNQDVGLDVAWQMMEAQGMLSNKVRIMIVDGGFSPNLDFPDEAKIRKGQWGASNDSYDCGGNPCPWHGTQVAMAATARMDNEYGVAGPAGPVAELIAVRASKDFWARLRRTKKMVKEEHPHIVNMSFGTHIQIFRSASLKAANRHFKNMKNRGALLFASAGNDGIDVDSENCVGNNCYEGKLILPCESPYVVCVGGMGKDTTWKHAGSNFGSGSGGGSVEIYGPYCVVGLEDPGNAYSNVNTKSVCGTSFASPFVAGVAALVKAADPGLSPDGVWQIVRDTAHEGGVLLPMVVGDEASQRRINAYAAVRQALGLSYTVPTVEITSPVHNSEHGIDNWLILKGSATTFYGYELPISWHSSIDGDLTDEPQSGDVYLTPLSVGTHVITAEATDLRGGTGSAQIIVKIVDTPPIVTIIAPEDSEEFYEGQDINLSAFTKDPDTYGPLDDSAVFWQVRRPNDQLVFTGGGHADEVPGNLMTAGTYTITLSGGDDNNVSEDSVTITVKAIPPNETPPTAIIDLPASALQLTAYNGQPQTITFKGRGWDPENGNLPANRLRWTAKSENGTKIVLCDGSAFEGGGLGDIVTYQGCGQFDAELGLDPGSVGYTKWTITLEVKDYSGLTGKATVDVEILFTTG